MGAKQSSPAAIPAANGRTRAYSGSDLPSSTSSSNGSNVSRTTAGGVRYHAYSASVASSSTSQHHGARARSVGGSGTRTQSGINIPNSSGAYNSQESGGSSPEEADRERPGGGHEGPRLLIGSLPAHLSPHLFGGFKCPVCSKYVSSDEMDLHLVLCLTKPRVTYNGFHIGPVLFADSCGRCEPIRASPVTPASCSRAKEMETSVGCDQCRFTLCEDVLTKDAGECAICLEELVQGDTIARLPCLCIYHKGCIDEWFEVNRSCPEHPSD